MKCVLCTLMESIDHGWTSTQIPSLMCRAQDLPNGYNYTDGLYVCLDGWFGTAAAECIVGEETTTTKIYQMIWNIHEHSMYHFLEMFVFTFEIFETLEGICQYDQYVSLGCNKSHGPFEHLTR